MKVHEVCTQRFNVALELMREGQTLTFDNVHFCLGDNRVLKVYVDASKVIDEITKDSASQDIERAIAMMNHLKENSSEFKQLIEGYAPRFIYCSNYGTGSVELARLVGDKIVWSHGLPSPVQ